MSDKKTLIAVKIRANDTTHQLWSLAKILLLVFGVIAAIGGLQYLACQRDTPHASLTACLTPKIKK